MKVRMRTLLAGPAVTLHPGQVADLDTATAKALIEGGYAESVQRAVAPIENASVTQPETADVKFPAKKGKRRG